jgi:hypothetical protein
MAHLNWTRHHATSQGREAVRAAADNWYALRRVQAELEEHQREVDRKARIEDKAWAKREREIARLKRLWARVKSRDSNFDLE